MARPPQFERDDVLRKAMEVFWAHGYHATSMSDLVAATDLKSGSLYAAFGSKQGLFLDVLDAYGTRTLARLEETLADATSPLDGIRSYFRKLAEDVSGMHGKSSCLLVNTVLELSRHNDAVQTQVNRQLEQIEALFRQALQRAQTTGELGEDADPAALAAFLMCNIWGLRVLAGTSPSKEKIKAVVDQILSVLPPR